MSPHNRWRNPLRAIGWTILTGILANPALGAIQQDQMVNGGGKATATANQVTWAALGEPLGGKMSGGGFIIQGGGSPPPGNAAPTITAFSPADKSKFYKQTVVTLSVTATDADNDPLQYRFLVDGVVLQDWGSSTSVNWDTTSVNFGWHTLRVEVKDPTHTVSQQSAVFIFWRPPSP